MAMTFSLTKQQIKDMKWLLYAFMSSDGNGKIDVPNDPEQVKRSAQEVLEKISKQSWEPQE